MFFLQVLTRSVENKKHFICNLHLIEHIFIFCTIIYFISFIRV